MMENPRPGEIRLPIRNAESRRPAREAQSAASSSPRHGSAAPRTEHYRTTVEDYPGVNRHGQPSHYDSRSSTHSRSRYAATEAASQRNSPRPRGRGYRNSGSKAEEPGRRATFETSSDEGEGMTHRRRSHRGHRFHDIINQGHTRTQLGDMYIENQTVHNNWERASSERNDDKRIDILEALAFDYMDTRILSVNAAYGQTCRWLFSTNEYIGWRRSLRTGSRRRFLWIKGKPGAGKSTMMKLAFEQACEHFPRSKVASFFFNARGHGAAKMTEGMYRSLLHQILTKLPRLPSRLPSHIGKSVIRDGWPVTLLQNLLQEALLALPKEETLIFYIDALDECDEDDIRLALEHFEELMAQSVLEHIGFLVCFASRHYPNISVRHHRPMNVDSQPAHLNDIFRYVNNTLEVPGSLGRQLRDSISARCGGVFLWAVLTVRILNKSYDEGCTRSHLQARLSEVPSSIQALFNNVLQERDDRLLPTLQWVLFSQRALEIQELYFAVMTSVGQIPTGLWDREEIDISGMESFVLQSSRGLVEIKNGVAQVIHETVREFLLGGGLTELDSSLKGQVVSGSHARLAQWCQTYIALDTAYHCERQDEHHVISPYRDDYHRLPLLDYTLSSTVHHMQIAFDEGVLTLAASRQFADTWLTLGLYRYTARAHYECAALLCFLLARDYQRLEPGVLGRSVPMEETFSRTSNLSWYMELSTEWNIVPVLRKPATVLRNAATFASLGIARLFRDRKRVKTFQTLVDGVLFMSAGLGLDHVPGMLVEYAARLTRTAVNNALNCAALGFQQRTTRQLLQLGADPDECMLFFFLQVSPDKDSTLLDMLTVASAPLGFEGNADESRVAIATELLDHHATSKFALERACRNGRTELARLFIDRGAPVNLEIEGQTDSHALRVARWSGHDEIVRMLIEAGATEQTNARKNVLSDESTKVEGS